MTRNLLVVMTLTLAMALGACAKSSDKATASTTPGEKSEKSNKEGGDKDAKKDGDKEKSDKSNKEGAKGDKAATTAPDAPATPK